MLSSKHKPNSLNFNDYNLNSSGQFTPSTPTVISLLQDLTPTNCGYNFEISDKDDVLRQFSMHYKSIEDSHKQNMNDSQLNYAINNNNNNNNNFTLELLSDDLQNDVNMNIYSNSYENLNRPLPSESVCSSDVQSCSSNNDSNSSHQFNSLQSAKKRERNRLAAEKCRLKKQSRITELENEKRKRIQENSMLMEKVKKRTETIKKLRIFYNKLKMGEFQSQPFY